MQGGARQGIRLFPPTPADKRNQNHHILFGFQSCVSEITLGIFGVQFWGFSVLHCHGVFPSGDQQQQQKPLQQQEEKVAKIHSNSKKKSNQNHHFLWVSEIMLGIFGVQFWGFSVLHCHGVFPIRGPAAAAKASAAAGGKGSQNS